MVALMSIVTGTIISFLVVSMGSAYLADSGKFRRFVEKHGDAHSPG